MALVNGTNYDHIDLQAAAGGDVTRHRLQDTEGRAMLAPAEASTTASAAHAAGTYFILGGVLYKATADIAQGGTIVTSGSGQNCVDAKVGDSLSELKSAIDDMQDEIDNFECISDDVKTALLNCFENVAWINDQGQSYYDALESALNPKTLMYISAVFNQGQNVFYNEGNTLNDLKPYLTVTAHYADESTKNVIGYTLIGDLTAGTSIITVSFGGKTTYFNVIVSDYYQILTWTTNDPLLLKAPLYLPGLYGNTCGYANSNIRRGAWAKYGMKGAYNYNTGVIDDTTYPIPMPSNVTSVTVTVTNIQSAMIAVGVWDYDETTQTYSRLYNGGWRNNGTTEPLVEGDFITVVLKVDSEGTTPYTTEPNVILAFS